MLKCAVALGVGATLHPSFALAQDPRSSQRPAAGDRLVRVDDESHRPLGAGEVPPGGMQTFAWAMDPADGTVRDGSRLNRVLLVSLDPSALSADTRSRAADGVVAYTAICTHSGCEVIDWLADGHLLNCPCHLSTFDPKDGGRVVDGPAPRALPALPLKIEDGRLVVAGPFTSRVGFETS
jgi:Rieske Fe-S protein